MHRKVTRSWGETAVQMLICAVVKVQRPDEQTRIQVVVG
jgi:hypothetical protein